MRSFLGKDILSLKDFERAEFLHVQNFGRAGADHARKMQYGPTYQVWRGSAIY